MGTKILFIVYQGDTWLTKSSFVFRGLFDTLEQAIEAIVSKAEIDTRLIEKSKVRENLSEWLQSIVNMDDAFIIETVELNKWEGELWKK
ncbi:MAG: hypothetical protein ACI3ZD_11155 [Prevotella sp.]